MNKVGLALVVLAASASGEDSRRITVITANYAQAPDELLSEARAAAGEIFAEAGVEVRWLTLEEADRCAGCTSQLGRSTFYLRIVPNSMISSIAVGHDYLGYSIVPAGGAPGYIAGAYFERVKELAKPLGCKASLLLGYVIAHELGHLLLGAGSHARSGVMSYPVEGEHMRLAAQGRLNFNRAQAERLRRNPGN